MGISRKTVRAALASDAQPKYERASKGSIVDAVEPRIRELLAVYPTMPATGIPERSGWSRSIRVLSSRVAELRPVYLPPDPASRTSYVAGEIAQCDVWFPPIELPVGFGQTRTAKQLPVLTMVLGYSRWLLAMLLPSRQAEDLFAGWWRLIQRLGAVPRVLVWDGEGAIGRWRGGRSELTTDCQAFRGTLGAKVVICRPADPEAKGIIERAHDYLERSFLPGRSFAGPVEFNTQLTDWLAVANTRPRRGVTGGPGPRGPGSFGGGPIPSWARSFPPARGSGGRGDPPPRPPGGGAGPTPGGGGVGGGGGAVGFPGNPHPLPPRPRAARAT